MPSKMESLEVNLYCETKNESLRSAVVVVIVISDSYPRLLLKAEKPLLNAENLKLLPKLLEGVKGGERELLLLFVTPLLRKLGMCSELVANEYALL